MNIYKNIRIQKSFYFAIVGYYCKSSEEKKRFTKFGNGSFLLKIYEFCLGALKGNSLKQLQSEYGKHVGQTILQTISIYSYAYL